MITSRAIKLRTACLLPVLALLMSCATSPTGTRSPSEATRTTTSQEPSRGSAASSKTDTQQRLINEANALSPLASTELGKRFLHATEALPAVGSRVAFRDDNTREFFSKAEADALAPERRGKLAQVTLDEYRFYYTKYGSPLAYLRALEIAAANGLDSVAGERILDFGYGSIGHLRLLASIGAHVVGVDPDSYLDALYSSADQGAVPPARGVYRGAPGTIHLVHERWPTSAAAAARVGSFGPYRLIVSKNTLKRGYIKPERRANKNQLIDLGVDDATFLKAIHDNLVPGGMLLIYNLAPQQNPADKPFLPHADARSPFSPEQFSRAGFQVVAHNVNDDAFVRKMGSALGWDKNDKGEVVNDLATNLFAQYTLVKRIK
ncbi:MAG: class I SAM-dependent methyltransferase [Nitrosomonadaceae bacterium]|jgi:hypothetical protein|nr:class I SAM-dependent methyltransferase [Nitrosomonadaceae bacterium]